jgi:hypothetical protein
MIMTVLQYHRLPVLAHQHRLSFSLFFFFVYPPICFDRFSELGMRSRSTSC